MSTTQKEQVKTPAKTEEKPVLTISKKNAEQGEPLNFEDTELKLNQLWALHSKLERLRMSQRKLKEFVFKNDGTEPYTLSLGNGYRNEEFSTKNPEILKDVIAFLSDLIDRKAAEIQAQIRW